MFNKVVLMGNLTRDIEIRHTSFGLSIGNTAIATSRKFKSQTGEQKEEVCFIDITFFGRTAEVAQQYLHKGSRILVDGRLKLDQWTDSNGNKRSKHSVTVETMQMLGGRETEAGLQRDELPKKSEGATPAKEPDAELSIDEGDIPF